MSKLISKDMSLIDTVGFYDLFKLDISANLDHSLEKMLGLSRFLQMVDIPSTCKKNLFDIQKHNWTLLIAKQLATWHTIQESVIELI